MASKDAVIIDGNAVYEIDHNCAKKIRSAEKNDNQDNILQWLLIAMLLM